MRVTREVVYDLLPAYFAGDASDDTRALVEAYFETDPEFARMASRFQQIADRPRPGAAAAARERETFCSARAAAELPQKTRATALGFGFASLFSFAIAFMTWNERMGLLNPGILLGLFFGVMAIVVFAMSYYIKPDSWWRDVMGLDDQSLRSMTMERRSRRRLDA